MIGPFSLESSLIGYETISTNQEQLIEIYRRLVGFPSCDHS